MPIVLSPVLDVVVSSTFQLEDYEDRCSGTCANLFSLVEVLHSVFHYCSMYLTFWRVTLGLSQKFGTLSWGALLFLRIPYM